MRSPTNTSIISFVLLLISLMSNKGHQLTLNNDTQNHTHAQQQMKTLFNFSPQTRRLKKNYQFPVKRTTKQKAANRNEEKTTKI